MQSVVLEPSDVPSLCLDDLEGVQCWLKMNKRGLDWLAYGALRST